MGDDSLGVFGSVFPFSLQPVPLHDLSIPLDLEAGETRLFLRVHEPLGPCNLQIDLVPDARLAPEVQAKAFADGAVTFYLVAILIISLYLQWAVREPAFAWYSAWLACAIGWYLIKRGVAFAWIWPDHPRWNPSVSVFFAFIAAICFAQFLCRILAWTIRHPRWGRVVLAWTLLQCGFAVLAWWPPVYEFQPMRLTANASLIGLFTSLLCVLVSDAWNGHRLARKLLLAFLPLALGFIFGALVEFGFAADGPAIKTAVLTIATLLENTLTVLVLANEMRRREADRVSLERDFHRRVVERSDEGMREIAQELHDNLGSGLAALRMQLFGIYARAPSAGLAEFDQRIGDLAHIARNLSHKVSPPTLEVNGLLPALRTTCADFASARQEVLFSDDGVEPDLDITRRIHLYRIVQEGVANALRHGGAELVEVSILQRDGQVELEIRDTGRGFDVGTATPGLGLQGIKSRTESLRGRFALSSGPGQGTSLKVVVPIG